MDIETKGILIKLINIMLFGDTSDCDDLNGSHSHGTFEEHDRNSLNELLEKLNK